MTQADPQEQAPPTRVQVFKGLSSANGQGAGRRLFEDARRLARRQAVWELRQQGKTQRTIGDVLEISQPTVYRDLRWCHKQYEKRLVDQVSAIRAEQVAVLEYILQEALDAWAKSKEEAVEFQRKSLVAQAGTGAGQAKKGKLGGKQPPIKPLEQTTKVKERVGDVSFLREARDTLKDIRDITGAGRPKKVALTDPSGEYEAAIGPGVVIVLPAMMTMDQALASQAEDGEWAEVGPEALADRVEDHDPGSGGQL